MKKLQSYFLLLMLALSFSACENYFDDINEDPNNPGEVTPSVLLSTIETRLTYAVWGDGSRYLGLNTQHIDGVNRQFVVYQNYGIQPADLDALWGQNLYSGVLMDINRLLQLSEPAGYNHYSGVAKILEAYTLLFIADMWGDAPYTDAFQGLDALQPEFDTQESLFGVVFKRLEEATDLLAADPGLFAPGSDDIIYGGSIASWSAFINVLEARAHLHLSKRENSRYQSALDALARGGFGSVDGDARFQFANSATGAAPWYQYIQQRDDIEVGDSYKALMQGLNDPRDTILGAPLELPHPVFAQDRRTPVLSYVEEKFIEAECLFQTSGSAAAHDAYIAAITASFADLAEAFKDIDLDSDAELAAYLAQGDVDPGTDNLTLEHIMTQKYIALYSNPEVFNDWRRTDIPTLVPNTGDQIPRRLPYGQDEILQNSNTPAPDELTIYDRVWWDAE